MVRVSLSITVEPYYFGHRGTGQNELKAWATLARLRNDFVTNRSQDAIVATLKSIVEDGNVTISLHNCASVAEPLLLGDHITGTSILFVFTMGNYLGRYKGDPNGEVTIFLR